MPSIALTASLLLVAFCIFRAFQYLVWAPLTSPLKRLQFPPGGTKINGHAREINSYYMANEWDDRVSKLGKTFAIKGPMVIHDRLFTIDPRAVSYVMNNAYTFGKPEILRKAIRMYMREGLIVSEGDRHKIQRKIAARLFSNTGLKEMKDVIQEKIDQLTDIIMDLCINSSAEHPISPDPVPEDTDPSTRQIDVFGAAMRTTYDIVGQIALGHSFDSVGHPHGEGGHMFELYEHGQTLGSTDSQWRKLITLLYPWVDKISPSAFTKRVNAAMGPLDKLAKKLVADRKKALSEGKDVDQRDLLTLMVRADLAEDVPPDQRLHEAEVWGQLATFMFAGSDTTANVLAYTLLLLAQKPEIQDKLRKEMLGYGETLDFEQIDDLVYLDAVIKETLRVNPSIPGTIRQAKKDDVIPLAEPIKLADGTKADSVRIRAGQMVHIPIELLNMSPAIWGPTAHDFDPSRWLTPSSSSGPATALDRKDVPNGATQEGFNDGPGVWPNVMTFIDGPRRCVAYKLAIMELKIMTFALVRNFVFTEVPEVKVYKWNLFSTRPYVARTLISRGSRLPLLVTPYKPDH